MKKVWQQSDPADRVIERAYLVGVSLPNSPIAEAREHLDELSRLATTAGAIVAGKTVQGRTRIDGATFIGSGKVHALKEECERLNVNLVIFDSDLSPAQARNVEKILAINVIDRTELILDIFSRHAKTQQAKLQVELAQLNYSLPRLRKLWDHLSRQVGGIGTRGPGETQLEVDRRHVRERIGRLKKQLKALDKHRSTMRRSHSGCPMVALVGYTNAGKSTLMNALTGANTLAENQLFATLDTLTRKMETRTPPPILLVDTVGFIRKLPHHLVESFKATLGDIARAELCVHVIDVSHPGHVDQLQITDRTLSTIKRDSVYTLYVYNKTDVADKETIQRIQTREPEALFISAAKGAGLDELKTRIEREVFGRSLNVEVKVSAVDGKGIAQAKSLLQQSTDSVENGYCILTGIIESRLMARLERIDGIEVKYLF